MSCVEDRLVLVWKINESYMVLYSYTMAHAHMVNILGILLLLQGIYREGPRLSSSPSRKHFIKNLILTSYMRYELNSINSQIRVKSIKTGERESEFIYVLRVFRLNRWVSNSIHVYISRESVSYFFLSSFPVFFFTVSSPGTWESH